MRGGLYTCVVMDSTDTAVVRDQTLSYHLREAVGVHDPGKGVVEDVGVVAVVEPPLELFQVADPYA